MAEADAGHSGAKGDADPQTGDKQNDAGSSGDKSYTKAEVEKIVSSRLAKLEKQLEELKPKAEGFDKLQDEKKSEVEKLTEQVTKLSKDLDDSKDALKTERVRVAVVSEAASKGIVDADAAYRLLDSSSLEFDDEGNPKNVSEAVTKLVEAKPYLVGDTRRWQGSGDGGPQGSPSSDSPDEAFGQLIKSRLGA
jgi:hypothetical protein